MEPQPTNAHERQIAKIIDARCKRDECSYQGGILEVTGSVHFSMSEDDIKYMVAALKPNCLRSAHA